MRLRGRRGKRTFGEAPLTIDGTYRPAPSDDEAAEHPLGLAEGGVGSSRMVGKRTGDDWTSPFSSDPLESVRIIDRRTEPEPALTPLELPEEPVAPEPEPEPEPMPEPAPVQRPDNLVSKYGGRYATFGRSASTRMKAPETRVASGEYGRETSSYDGFARRLEAQRGGSSASAAVADTGTGSFPVIGASLPIPSGDRLSPSDFDASIKWQDRFGAESAQYRAYLLGASAHRVLDLGCRTGRLALHFASWGFDIIGVDEDPEMIAAAEALAAASREEIEHTRGSIEFVQGRAGDLERMLGFESVDAVMCVGNVFPELADREDLRRVLGDLNAVMKTDGVFIASFDNYRKFKYEGRRAGTPTVIETDRGTRLYIDVYDYLPGGTHVDVTRLMGLRGPDGTWKMTSATLRHMVITHDMLTRELVDAGFDIVDTADPYDAARTSPLEAETVQIVARKRLSMRSGQYR